MSLNWDIEEVQDYKELLEGEAWTVTDALIWATMAIEMGEITKKNHKEFFMRVAMWESVAGPWVIYEGGFRPITLEDVKRRIGLKTNVYPDRTKVYYHKKLGQVARDKVAQNLRLAEREEEGG